MSKSGGAITLADLESGGKLALTRALAALERAPEAAASLSLLDAAFAAPRAQVIGVTGPPGVGKSTLLGRLIGRTRESGQRVAVIAVDPSSRRSGGALLGDRIRLITDPADEGVFVRSMAARDRLGGLADLTMAAMVLLRALYDRVLIETVGVGQSEADVAGVADTVVFCVQPASGDALQFMKAGIVEIPHIAVVTKADLGNAASRALADLKGALSLTTAQDADEWPVVTLAASATRGDGLDALLAALDRRAAWLGEHGRLAMARQAQAEAWLREAVRDRFGRDGLARAAAQSQNFRLAAGQSPFARLAELAESLRR
ncbi:MAG TPA: GTP-binding protein [Kiloniellales bacterium]|jgi:LAO/AO transport system kinase